MATQKIDHISVKAGSIFLSLLIVSSLCAYPLVLFNPVNFANLNFPWLVRFPVEIFICALSFIYLLLNPYKLTGIPRSYGLAFLIFGLAVLGSSLAHRTLPDQGLIRLATMIVPLAVAVAVLRGGLFSQRRQEAVMYLLGLAWLVILFCFFLAPPASDTPNWFSLVTIALSPWAFFSAYHLLRILFKTCLSVGIGNPLAGVIALFLVAGFTILVFLRSSSRGTLVALLAYAVLMLILKLRRKWRIASFLLILVVIVGLFASALFKQPRMKDVREPLWKNTIKMAIDSPGIGWGPGNFQKVYPRYRSVEHSVRLPASLSTEHPQNEFLYLAAEVGFPAALIWLFFAGSLLFIKVRSREGHCALFGFCMLFIHSFFDQGLLSPPESILFYLFAGLMAARWLRTKISPQGHGKAMFLLILISSMICLIPISMRMKNIYQSQLVYRQTSILKSMDEKGLVRGLRKVILNKIYRGYCQAADLDSFNIRYPYMALQIAIEKMHNVELAEAPLQQVLNLDGNYEHANYLTAMYYTLLASNDSKLRDEYLETANKLMNRELRLYPFDLKLHKFIFDYFILRKERLLANSLMKNSLKRLVTMYIHKNNDGAETLARLKKWQEHVEASDQRGALASAAKILSGLKGIDTIDSLLPSLASTDGFMVKHNDREFHQTDFQYWQEILQLRRLFKKGKTGEALVKELLEDITINRQQKFNWPQQVLKSKQASELSLSCLLRMAGHLQGYLTLIVKLETLDKVHWLVYMKNDQEEFLVWPSQKKIMKGHYKALFHKKYLEKEVGENLRQMKFFLFEYPQAFLLRNVYLSTILGQLTDFKSFCSPPTLIKMNLEAFLNKHWSIGYLRQPFLRLEQDNQ